jgi:hypothetical protein
VGNTTGWEDLAAEINACFDEVITAQGPLALAEGLAGLEPLIQDAKS